MVVGRRLTDDAALIAVDGSGSRDFLFHDVEGHNSARVGMGEFAVGEVSDAEQDLPCEQVGEGCGGEEGGGRWQAGMLGEEGSYVGPERAGQLVPLRRESQEVVQIGRHPSFHPL